MPRAPPARDCGPRGKTRALDVCIQFQGHQTFTLQSAVIPAAVTEPKDGKAQKNVRVFDQKALTELNAVSLRFVSRFQSLCSNRIEANRVSSHISPAGETPEHVCDCWLTVTTTLLVSAITFTVDHE